METGVTSSRKSGGATTSHTIMVPALQRLLSAVGAVADPKAYQAAVLDGNVLGKDTIGARRRTFRYLRELYSLNRDVMVFRALSDLWPEDPEGQPLLAGLCALARDPVFRASSDAVFNAEAGDQMNPAALAEAVERVFPETYSEATLAKIGRNTCASWEQSGHLMAQSRTLKLRQRAVCTPATTAFALFLGHLEGLAGAQLLDTLWVRALDRPRAHVVELAAVASQRSLIDFRHSGGVMEVRFAVLARPAEGQLL